MSRILSKSAVFTVLVVLLLGISFQTHAQVSRTHGRVKDAKIVHTSGSVPVDQTSGDSEQGRVKKLAADNQEVVILYEKSVVHPFIAEQALELLLDSNPYASSSGIVKDELENDYENDLARYWSSADPWIGMRNGTIEEDTIFALAGDLITTLIPSSFHFWRPWLGWNEGLIDDLVFDSALKRALVSRNPDLNFQFDTRGFWEAALEHYLAGEKGASFFNLGRMVHLLADMSVPAHTHNDTHLPTWALGVNDEKYEVYTYDFIAKWRNSLTGLSLQDIQNFGAGLETPPNWPSYPAELTDDTIKKSTLTRIFFTTARNTSLFESDNADGYNDGSEYWPGVLKAAQDPSWYIDGGLTNEFDLSDLRCEMVGNAMIPQAIKSAGLAIQTFVEFVDHNGPVTQVEVGGTVVYGYGEVVTRDAAVSLGFDSLDVGSYAIAGLDRINYRDNDGPWQIVQSGTVYIDQMGTHEIEFYAIDKLGNIERDDDGHIKSFSLIIGEQSPFVLSSPRVTPMSGLTSDAYTFRVNYYDPDGDVPTVMQLILDSQLYPVILESGVAANGVYKVGPLSLSTDTHNYSFHFENGIDPSQDTAAVQGPEVTESEEPSGRNVAARDFHVDPYQVSPGGNVTLSAAFDNLGSQVEDITVHWLLYSPSGTIIRDVQEAFLGISAGASAGIKTKVLTTNSTTGYWTAAVRAELSVDDDPSDNFRSGPFNVGTATNYTQYKCQDGIAYDANVAVYEGTGVYAFRVKTFWSDNDGAECEILKNGAVIVSSVFLNQGDVKKFDSNQYFIYVWAYNDVREEIGVYHGRPHSTPFTYTPIHPRGPAGTTVLWKSQPQSGQIQNAVSGDIVNSTLVRSWYVDFSKTANVLTREFEVPADVAAGSYRFWIQDELVGYDDYYFRESYFIVDPAHDVSLQSPSPTTGSSHIVGDVVPISVSAMAINSYKETPSITLLITGPSSYLHSETQTPSFSATTTVNFAGWNTAGLTAGDYTLTFTSALDDDVESGNDSVASVVHLDSVPVPPITPTLQTCTAASSTAIDIAWIDNSGDETGFRIDVSSDGIQWAVAGNVSQNSIAFQAGGLSPATLYYFRVVAANTYGESSSNVLAARTNVATAFTSVSPNGGGQYERGKPLNITWTWTGSITSVNVMLIKGRGSLSYLAAGIPNEGHFTWSVEADQEIASDYRIRIENADDLAIWAGSSSDFSIVEISHSLMIYSSTGGTTNPAPGLHVYVKNENISISPVASSGYVFSRWGGDIVPGQESTVPLPVVIDADKMITAIFSFVANVQITGTVTLSGSPLAGVVMNGLTGSPVTNASGVYTGTEGVGWTGTVTPTLAGYTFSPVYRTYSAPVTSDQAAEDFTASLSAPGDENWDGQFGANGVNGYVRAITVAGTDVYAGGQFTQAGGNPANHIAKWDTITSTWSALGNGVNNLVYAIAVSGTDVYVGGMFTDAGNYIAKWDTLTSTWSALGSGLNGYVRTIAVSGADVYVGGNFTEADGSPANYVARWNGTSWSALGGGTSGRVYTIAVSGADVCVGGSFLTAEGLTVQNVAKWNGTSGWSDLGGGVTGGSVYAIAFIGPNVYVAGDFTNAGGLGIGFLAIWKDTTGWSAPPSWSSNYIDAIAVSGTDVYVGQWDIWGGNTIKKLDTVSATWSMLGSGMGPEDEFPWVYAVAATATDVYVGGKFTTAGGKPSYYFGRWMIPLVRAVKVDFNNDGQEDILWRYYGSGGYNRAWFLGNTGGAGLPAGSAGLQMESGLNAKKLAGNRNVGRSARSLRDMGVASNLRKGSLPMVPRSLMGPKNGRMTGLTAVDDPRKAGGKVLPASPLGIQDPRRLGHALDPAAAGKIANEVIAAPVLQGGADVLPVGDLSWQIVGTGDFNNDTHVDILWRYNGAGGYNVVWYMNGADWAGSAELIPVNDLNWRIVGTGDFNNDTHVDILWRNVSDGTNVVWYMNGVTWSSSAVLLGVSDPNWQIVGTGDFNNDDNVDILWRYYGAGGYNVVWHMNGAAWSSSAELIPVGDASWMIMGTGDYDQDGNIDILWRYNGAGGTNVIWYMNGVNWNSSAELIPVPDLNWRIVSR